MLLIIVIDLIVVVTLVWVATREGVEQALPYFIFFIVLLPQESRIRVEGAFDLYTHRVALAVLLVLFLVYREKSKIDTIPLKKLIFLHIAWATTSTVFSIVSTTSVKQLIAQLAEYYLSYYIILKTVTRTRTIYNIIYAMIGAMAVCCVFGLLEIYAGWSVLSIFPSELQLTYGGTDILYAEMFDRGVRARATFPHPIHFGGALAMTIPLAVYMVTSTQSRLKKIFLNVTLLLMFWSLYKTTSRGPWLATAFALVILGIATESRVRKRIVAVAAVAVLVMVARPGVAETLINIYNATMDPTSMMGSSFQYRPVLLHTVVKTLNENPERALLGFGLGSFREKGLILEMPGIETHRWYTCDSTWILFAYETGYVGFLILATILIKPAFLVFNCFRKFSRSSRQLCLALFSSLIAFYVVMISVAIYGWGQNGYMLWTVIALSMAYPILKKAELRSYRPSLEKGVSEMSELPLQVGSYPPQESWNRDEAALITTTRQQERY